MILKQKRHNGRKIAAAGVVAVLLIASVSAYFVFATKKTTPSESDGTATVSKGVNYSAPTQDQVDNGSAIKQNSISSGGDTISGSDSSPSPTYTSDSSKGTIGAVITSANQSGTMLQVRTLLQANTDTGTCTLTLSKSGQTSVIMTASVQAAAQTATCEGFSIDTTNLAKGSWNLTLTFENDTLQGTATSTATIS